jgi:hypothetical protein
MARRSRRKKNPVDAVAVNPISGAGAVVATIVAAGIAWLIFRPAPAAAAPSKPAQPPLPPAQKQPDLPPAQVVPEKLSYAPPLPQEGKQPLPEPVVQPNKCSDAKILQYKFAGEAPVIFTFRRVTTWDAANSRSSFSSTSWLYVSDRGAGAYNGDFGAEVMKRISSPYVSYYVIEMWIWSTDGWCLDYESKNWE